VRRRKFGLFGEYHLPTEALVLSAQGTEIDATGATATLGILPVPGQVVVSGLLLAVRKRRHQLARDVETGRVVS
jgi:hypothetical protein